MRSEKAYLSALVTRLCIDRLRSARARREEYVGPWLPEPLPDERAPDGRDRRPRRLALYGLFGLAGEPHAGRAGRLSVARGLRLRVRGDSRDRRQERGQLPTDLPPRQGLRGDPAAPLRALAGAGQRLMKAFPEACAAGDMDGLLAVLSNDVTLWSDGGERPARRATRSTARPTSPVFSSERSGRPRLAWRSGRRGSTAAPPWLAMSETAGPRARRPSGSREVGSRRSGSWSTRKNWGRTPLAPGGRTMKATPTLEPLVRQRTILLTTYRRDGAPVGTPVHVAVEGDRSFVRTWDTTGKLKRIRRNPGARFALPPSAAGRPGRRSRRVPGFSKERSLPTPAGCLPGSTRYCTVSLSRRPSPAGQRDHAHRIKADR